MKNISAKEQLRNKLTQIALESSICAKWMPRDEKKSKELREYLGMTPKVYRKTIVALTKVVETQMCAQQWDQINYEHVPSVAAGRYQAAFGKHDTVGYAKYREALTKGEAKINASAVYPYDVVRSMVNGDIEVSNAQWNALPNYVGDHKILPVCDVSGSMTVKASGSVTCLDVSVSLGLYLASKNTGAFKDVVATFSAEPEINVLCGSLSEKVNQMHRLNWGMNTNIEKLFSMVLDRAVSSNATPEDMPEMIVIFSDMQFDICIDHPEQSAVDMIRSKYETAGYKMPVVVFWNLNAAYDNAPAAATEKGIVMVSGFSPAIMKSILACDTDSITPEAIMYQTLNSARYSVVSV